MSLGTVTAVFLSNVPEGLSGVAGMREAGSRLASGVAAMIGYVASDGASPAWAAAVDAVATGAILAMIADTLASEQAREYAGLITTLSLLAAFTPSKLGGG